MEDAAFIVSLRTDPERNAFLHATSGDIHNQEKWIAEYLRRPADYYFIIEKLGADQPSGTIGIYDFDSQTDSAEWGRWVTRPYSAAGKAGLLLLLTLAFNQLGMDTLYCHTILENAKAIAIFEQLGFERVGLVQSYAQIRGTVHDALKFRVGRATWREARISFRPDVFSRNTCL
jgi:RimJ/RimL family protein N-acetyltransferase